MYDELSISFENPATDALGYGQVDGKLYCGRDNLQLQFKVKDRAFRKNEIQSVTFDYQEVESVRLVSKWFQPKILVFQTRSPAKLEDFPGAKVGKVELQVKPSSLDDARKVENLIRFKQSEAFVSEAEERLSRLREKS